MSRLKLFIVLGIAAVTLLALMVSGLAQAETMAAGRPDIGPLLAKAADSGGVRVIVGLDVPEFDAAEIAADSRAGNDQARAIRQTQEQILNRLAGFSIGQVTQFDYIPFMALSVDATALQALRDDPGVTSIVEDIEFAPDLARSLEITRAEGAHSLNYRGAGTAIAVLDTGVDKNHPDLSGKVVAEACYSTTDPATGRFSACPSGQNSQIGNGAAVPPSRTFDGFDHGTHVAGIAVGVAPDAKIVAIQVFGRKYETAAKECTSSNKRSPCLLTLQSDLVRGLERVIALRTTHNIVAVNLSLGSGAYVSACDNQAQFTTVKLLVDSLRANRVLTVAAAGNNSYRNAMGAPSCLSSTVSVGATMTFPENNIDDVADFSNLSSGTTLLAPGVPIEAAVPSTTVTCGDGSSPDDEGRCFKGGTSMAAPHVAGAVAVLRAAKPTATAQQIVTALSTTGPLVSDQRPAGNITKRRLDVYGALCTLVACDPDDFRVLTLSTPVAGAIASGDPQDIYYFNGTGNQRIVVNMTRINGTLDPFLSVWDSDGNLLAFNDNGAGGVNARVNLLILPRTGRYRIVADSAQGAQTGSYQISVSQGSSTQNPAPFIRSLQTTSATKGSTGFWLAIHGSNFLSSSVARLNGSNAPTSFSSSAWIWIYLYASNLSSPTTHTIDVVNPAPGGGVSLPFSFTVTSAFNGESRLLAPKELTTPADEKVSFAVEWVHPTASWRNMQNLEFKLADDSLGGPLWLRLTEDNPESTLYLLNSAGEPLYSSTLISGQPGASQEWAVDDRVTLHLDETMFFGSGQTIVLTPTVTFAAGAVGTYNVRFSVDDDAEDSEVQDADILGRFSILPAGCQVAPVAVAISGPATGETGVAHQYYATVSPPNATGPITYTWFPEPAGGQGTPSATYEWAAAGQQPVGVIAENCADLVSDIQTIPVYTTTAPDLTLTKIAPAVVLAGEPIVTTLTIANNGATTATSITVRDALPAGATYVSGGVLAGGDVTWTIPALEGYGAVEQLAFVMTAGETITNDDYSAGAAYGYSVVGGPAVTTRIVEAKVEASPLTAAELVYNGADGLTTTVALPPGSFFGPTTVALDELAGPAHPLSPAVQYAGRAIRLDAYQNNAAVPDLEPGEPLDVELNYLDSISLNLDPTLLSLFRWTGSQWSRGGIICQTDLGLQRVSCRVFAPLGEFVLAAGEQHAIYLPALVTPELSRSGQ